MAPEGAKPVGFFSVEQEGSKESSWKDLSNFQRLVTVGSSLHGLRQSCRTSALHIQLWFHAFFFATSSLQWCLQKLCHERMSLWGRISATKWGEPPSALGRAGICPPLRKREKFKKQDRWHKREQEMKVLGSFLGAHSGRCLLLPGPADLLRRWQCGSAGLWALCKQGVIVPQAQGCPE